MDENTFTIQLGYVEEVDGEYREAVKTIFSKDTGKFTNWTDADVFYENLNKSVVTTMSSTTTNGGWLGGIPSNAKNTKNKLWYGACKELVLPEAVENPYLWGRAWFETGLLGQTGQWTLSFVDENNQFLAAMAIEKSDKIGNDAKIHFIINEGFGAKICKTIPLTPSFWIPPNPYGTQGMLTNRNMFDIRKEKDKVTFYWYGCYFPYTVPFLKGKKVKRIQFYTGQWTGRETNQIVTRMGLRDVLVIDLKSQYWHNLPNRFGKGSDVVVAKNKGMNMIYRDGIRTLEDFITGSDFPYLKPGKNHIEFLYSDFTKTLPTITVEYERRWL